MAETAGTPTPGRGKRKGAWSIVGGLNALGEMRVRSRLSQQDLASALGCTPSWVSKQERRPLETLAGHRQGVIEWLKACGLNPGEAAFQAVLLASGSAPLVPDENVDVLARVAADLYTGIQSEAGSR